MPPKRRDHTKQRELLAAASEKLKALNEDQLADAVDYALTDNYADAAIYHRREKDRKTTNLGIGVNEAIRTGLYEAAAEAGVTLGLVAEEGLQYFVDGTFTPKEFVHVTVDGVDLKVNLRKAYGPADVNLTVRLANDLLAQAKDRCQDVAEELGWEPTPTEVIRQYFMECFPETVDYREKIHKAIGTTKAIRDHVQAAAEAAGTTLDVIAEEALHALLDGSLTPEQPQRAARGSVKGKAATISVSFDKVLATKADERCQALADELGWTPNLTQVIKQYLLTTFPLPDSE